MWIAFYKAKHGTWLDKLIAWWTRPDFWRFWESGIYSHCEIVFEDFLAFSASPREGCARFKYIKFINSHWDFIKLDEMFKDKEIKVKCVPEAGKSYDFIGVFFTFVLPLSYECRKRWFCSELVAKLVFNLPRPHLYHPNSLYSKLSDFFI